MHISYLPVLGTRIASVTYDEAVAAILEAAGRETPGGYVCAVNVHTVSLARRDGNFRGVLNAALLAVPDGAPLVWAHRLLGGRRLPERVYGPTLMLRVCQAAAEKGVPIYLYGGAPEVVLQLREKLVERMPALKIAGAFSPPFAERAADDLQLRGEIEALNASGARIVFVGLGAPKQERFMHRHAPEINAVQIGVGAAFDFHAGRVRQAPRWMQAVGLEWLFRLCCEPRRLWWRYAFYNPYFVVRLMLQRLGLDAPTRELTSSQETHA